jgi:hypothetical protein
MKQHLAGLARPADGLPLHLIDVPRDGRVMFAHVGFSFQVAR